MSVIKSKRKETTLMVFKMAKDLALYTINTCRKEKYIPKSQRWILSQPIVREAIEALVCMRRANSASINDQTSYNYRYSQQVEAAGHLEGLLTLVELASEAFPSLLDKLEYWSRLIISTDAMLDKWIASDKKRIAAVKHPYCA